MKSLFLLLPFYLGTVAAQKPVGFAFRDKKADKQLQLLWNGNLLTAYRYDDSVFKPFLYPVNTLNGITVTRGWPLSPRGVERTDHPHHTGLWMNYESVNGLDFWNNSTAIEPAKRTMYGTVRHEKIIGVKAARDSASLTVAASWRNAEGKVLLNEQTVYRFAANGTNWTIERASTLTAAGNHVLFKDVKDGFFALRVARELEMPSTQADVFTDAAGNQTAVAKMINNDGVTGNYSSSEGKTGDSVWGTTGRWCMLQGSKQGSDITIGIFDHPQNVGYPAYWHARGYGLFAVNPLGRNVFSNGKEELNYTLPAGKSVTFRYKVVIASGQKLSPAEMNRLADAFARQ